MPLYLIASGTAHISIDCPSPIAPAVTECIFSALIKPTKAPAAINYRIVSADNKYTLSRNDRLTHSNRSLAKILYALEWQIVADWTRWQRHCYLLHAAAVAHHRQGLIFVGGPGTGKTSFSILLMQAGLELLSDEFACLQPPNYQIIPFPRNFVIKPHLLPLVNPPVMNPTSLVNTINPVGSLQSPLHWGRICLNPVPLRKIFFLDIAPDSSYEVVPVYQHEAAAELVKHGFNPNHFKSHLPDMLNRICAETALYRLKSANPLTLPPVQQKALLEEILK